MIQVWIIDENGYYQYESKMVEKVGKGMTTIPLTVGYIKAHFNGTEWEEGATQEEIEAWNKANKIDICPAKTTEEKLEELINHVTEIDELVATLTLEVM